MNTINSNRITGLATGMDIDEMVTNMITGEQSKVDKAEQKKQTQVWQQEIYRDVIKDVKGLYDKYFNFSNYHIFYNYDFLQKSRFRNIKKTKIINL